MASNHEGPPPAPDSDPTEETAFVRILESFEQATRLQVRRFPVNERRRVHAIDGRGHPFCGIIRGSAAGREKCLRDIHRAVQISMKTGEPYIFQCHCEMIAFAAALMDEGKTLTAFLCGPILLRHVNPFLEQSLLAMAKSLSLDEARLMQTVPEIPVLPERRVQAAADLLHMIANYFSKASVAVQTRQHEIARQQALLAEGLILRKKGRLQTMPASPAPLQSRGDHRAPEGELIDLIKMGDRKRARELLDELLGTTLFRSHEHIAVLKARALEIIFTIARAAVDIGANLEEILGLKYQCIQDLSKDDSPETLYYFLKKTFDQLFECIYQNRNIRHTRVFTKAKEFIWGNCHKGISLKNTAEAVDINPYYLSHLFRKEMGLSFLEYLTSVRISTAKKLLQQTNRSIMDICLEVGYQDPSHFAKIFKKKEALSPAQYRKRMIEQTVGGGG